MCEINSKGPDPPRSPQGYSLPKRTQGGGPALGFYLIHSHSNFRSGPLILSLEGRVFEFYFCPTWGLVPILFSDVSPLQFRSNLHVWLGRKKQQPWLMKLMKSPAKLASNCKVHEVYCVEHCCHVYQTHRYTFSHLETLLFLNFQVKICQDIEFDPNKKAAKILYFFCSRIAASTKRGEAWRKNQEEIKSMSPTLIDEPLCKTGISHRCTFFSWETCDMFISFRTTETETMSILSPLPLEKPCQKQIISRTKFPHWNPFVWPAHQGQTLKLISKKATKSWKPTSHLVQSLVLKLGGKTWR